jgi:lysine 2,3-aminomutase
MPVAAFPQATVPNPWSEVSPAEWTDWHWQLGHRLNSRADLEQLIQLTPEEQEALDRERKFRVDITPYFARLIDPVDPHCPIRRQVIPLNREFQEFEGMRVDSLAEDEHSPVPGLVHRYPDRVLMLVTTHCASYCRYCTRSRMVGDPQQAFSKQQLDRQLEYLRRTPQVRDVLLSGGDPLTLSDALLEYLLSQLRQIEHIEIVRMSTRVPVFLPQRITADLCALLRRHHPFWLNVHVNHPKEITPELSEALAKLADAGIPLGCQSVLLAGINDSLETQRQLVHQLVQNRVRPYYLYQCDLVKGAGHFRTSIAKGIEIIEGLRGHTSGYAVPTFVVDLPEGGGKVPVGPHYILSQGAHRVVLRNYEGLIVAYEEPQDYVEPARPPQPKGSLGVSALLQGEAKVLKPEDFESHHHRPYHREVQ